ncbi:hypothetical protein B0T10DRAFT_601050 [Thelonectria olida]|uniref:GPI anchored cell wall protein n=1 Tax=Thelonectria olida TaxID=1576542 RepID=A0A9P9B019_9HYPO|nr:hypothetical protein B0T10DRAFT_601050 [Thelonectria olida]
MLPTIPFLALVGAATAAAASSAQTTVEITYVGFIFPTLDASVIGVNNSVTTMMLHCPSNTTVTTDSCDLNSGSQLFTGNPTTMAYTSSTTLRIDNTTSLTYKVNCDLHTTKESAYCTGQRTNHIIGASTTVTKTWSTEEWFSGYKMSTATVRVTAGVEKLKAAESTTTKTSAATTGSDSAAQTSSTDNAAGPAITQHVVAAGVAALFGGAAIML